MGAKNNSARGLSDWFAMHLEVMEVVKLLVLAGTPLFQGAEGAKFAPSESTDSLLSRSDGLGLNE